MGPQSQNTQTNFVNPLNSSTPTTTTFSQTPQNIARSQNIKKLYATILGREVNDSDLSYIINANIQELDLIKRMVESEEHAELIKSRQEVIRTQAEIEKIKRENKIIQAKSEDVDFVNSSLRNLVTEKGNSISEIKEEIYEKDILINKLQKDNSILARKIRKANEGLFTKLKNILFKQA